MQLEMLAREFAFDVSDDDGATWTEIGGIASWKWNEDGGDVDVSDFDDAGWESSLIASRKGMLTLEGNFLKDSTTNARDEGQAMVEAAARLIGWAALRKFRVRTREVTGTPAAPIGTIIATGTPRLTERGGGNQDKMPWGVEVPTHGAPEFAGIFG